MESQEKGTEFSEMLDGFKHQFKSYMSTCYELYALKALQKVSIAAASILIVAMLALFVILLLVFVGIGLAIWLNETMAHTFCGFFIVAGFYALLAVLVYAFRKKWIRRTIQDGIICEMLKEE